MRRNGGAGFTGLTHVHRVASAAVHCDARVRDSSSQVRGTRVDCAAAWSCPGVGGPGDGSDDDHNHHAVDGDDHQDTVNYGHRAADDEDGDCDQDPDGDDQEQHDQRGHREHDPRAQRVEQQQQPRMVGLGADRTGRGRRGRRGLPARTRKRRETNCCRSTCGAGAIPGAVAGAATAAAGATPGRVADTATAAIAAASAVRLARGFRTP